MVSRVSGPIPPYPCHDTQDPQSQTYLKVPAPRVRPDAEDIAKQSHGTLCLALEVEGHSMPSAFRQTSVCYLCAFFTLLLLLSLRFNGHFPGEPGLASVY